LAVNPASLSPAVAFAPGNHLEPACFVDLFLEHPPRGFTSRSIGSGGARLPGFVADFDVTTTLHGLMKPLCDALPLILRRGLRLRSLFVGTTVTEYLPLPCDADVDALVASAVEEGASVDAALVVFKDLPVASPLLEAYENEVAARTLDACRRRGFVIVSGQALAWLPIDHASEEEFLGSLSHARRRDFRRKLRSRERLTVEELPTGARAFDDEGFVASLVSLYRNVYAQSRVQFDELTPGLLRELFRCEDGVLFLYRLDGALVGWNLCFVARDCLVDKFIGFSYPEARTTNLYFVSWFHNLEWARRRGLHAYVAGWTDPEVKRALGARFTMTTHAVWVRNPLLRSVLALLGPQFESDARWVAAGEG
jgi:GNAT acetyltransferase-like protein